MPDPPTLSTTVSPVIVMPPSTVPTDGLAATPSVSPVVQQQGSGGSNTLYLFTFLTTLLLLLAVSCAIIFRSFVLRRRYRRRMEEALAAGLALPEDDMPQWVRRRQKPRIKLGEKPKMWEVSLAVQEKAADWHGMTPVCTVVDRALGRSTLSKNAASEQADEHASPATNRHSMRRFIIGWPRSEAPQNADANDIEISAASDPVAALSPPLSDEDRLSVSLVIAMPDPKQPRYVPPSLGLSPWTQPPTIIDAEASSTVQGKRRSAVTSVLKGDEEEELPEIAFGVTDLHWKPAPRPSSDAVSLAAGLS